ncbi:MAG: hypothetical protein ACOYNL_10200 [Rickettsiales bacterium]
MQKTPHRFDENIIKGSKPYGEAMLKAAARLMNDTILQGLLALRKEFHENQGMNLDDYKQSVEEYLAGKNITLSGKAELSELLGYVNIKANNTKATK